MAQVIIRNLDEHVVQALKSRAELHGKALEQELREILTRASELPPADKLGLSDRVRALGSRHMKDDSTDLVREERTAR